MQDLNVLEQSLMLAKHNLCMAEKWLNFANLTTHQTNYFYNDLLNLPAKQMEALSSHSNIAQAFQEYTIDYAQRCILFLDVMRKRGNQYIDHSAAGSPPVLIFKYKIIVDGRTLEHPVNYALVEIIPPEGIEVDNTKRPFLIVDPRSGHGSGIGGFRDDSQVGVALRAGHPVYFVIFFPVPEPNQTLRDIAFAEKIFSDTVKERHPDSPKLCIIGNCQGGWAIMILAAVAPDLAGGLVINGAPLSYWEGENGRNPIRYLGGLAGGSWSAELGSDLGHGKFDGANLVLNFELLDPAANGWSRYYNLFANIDTHEKSFLALQRWENGFFLLNADEIRMIVDNLFIGNYLTHGKLPINKRNNLDLRKIHSPIIIFCSEGDVVAAPQQALNWIADIYEDELEIKKHEQTIIYLIHEDIGHFGIFMEASVAAKEHKEIVHVLEYIEIMPPGLYEMKIKKESHATPPQYYAEFVERTINDIKHRYKFSHHNNRDIFRTVRLVSQYNAQAYDMLLGPWVRMFSNELSAEVLRQMHPLRVACYSISDYNPFFTGLSYLADMVRANRQATTSKNPFNVLQTEVSNLIVKALNNYRSTRDSVGEMAFYSVYGTLAVIYKHILQREQREREFKFDETKKLRAHNTDLVIAQGNRLDAVIRILLLITKVQGFVKGASISHTREILSKSLGLEKENKEIVSQKIRTQSYLVAHDPQQALSTLRELIPSVEDQRFVLSTLKKLLKSVPLASAEAKQMWERIRKMLGDNVKPSSQQ